MPNKSAVPNPCEPKVSATNSWNSNTKAQTKDYSRARSTLSSKEIIERREKGLCFHCDEAYHPGKECKAKLYAIVGEAEDTPAKEGMEDVIREMECMLKPEESPGEISLLAMAGNKSMSTVRLQRFIKKQKVSILVDSRSAHSFIDTSLVKNLGLVAEIIPPLIVTVVDGSQLMVDSLQTDKLYDSMPFLHH